jgi:hypothetical protein
MNMAVSGGKLRESAQMKPTWNLFLANNRKCKDYTRFLSKSTTNSRARIAAGIVKANACRERWRSSGRARIAGTGGESENRL